MLRGCQILRVIFWGRIITQILGNLSQEPFEMQVGQILE